MSFRFTRRLTAAVVLAAAVGPGLTLTAGSAPAAAATCSTASGVSVLVDFKELGGGIQGTCVANGGGQRASSLFPTAGFPLTYVQNEPGFVCRVSAKPAQDPCVDTPPTDAYWGLWWSDGKNGVWNYANYGASALKVPAGSSVAFAWKQGGGSASAPGVAPPAPAAPTKAPTTAPTKKPSKQPGKPSKQPSKAATTSPTRAPAPQVSAPGSAAASSGTPSASLAATPSPSETPTATATGSASVAPEAAPAVPTETPSASATEISEPEVVPAAEQTTEDGGVPTWLVVVMLVALLGATGAVAVHRRRGADSSGP
ncbi:MAG TPA: hypothetical protein VMF51_05455 [Nocardioides sp.]|uniref:hypothetical protein n=1 Tax=Nocardioides sp. TaxID=35761 RepID=UPI002C2CBD74|nr:hypothetical protein [Nocardioides sp.]HTW14556.1 hypothetical protein [Nocardioides sp.]